MSLRHSFLSLALCSVIFPISPADLEHGETNNSSAEKTTTVDSSKVREALKDIAYYLRAHKFNEYDRRYETVPERAERRYYKDFPRPPLRSLHWEVHKFCEPSFYGCVDYLSKKLRYTVSKRVDDTVVVMREQRWFFPNNSVQIMQIDEECKKQRTIDDKQADPFEGPLERFQWRVTASYFMCWYTLKKVPDLEHLEEPCDNFANCLDQDFGPSNNDKRADDKQSYSCAAYSFCPDPCCPFKHITGVEACWESPENPCHRINKQGRRSCAFDFTQNTDFRWNVSCRCPDHGYGWNSRYGICKDADECVLKTHNCSGESESCVNLPGGFRCACKWGDIWNENTKKCQASSALELIKLGRAEKRKSVENSTGLFEKLRHFLFRKNSASSPCFQTPSTVQIFAPIKMLSIILLMYFCN